MKKQPTPPVTDQQFADAQKAYCDTRNKHTKLAARQQERIDKIRAEYADELRGYNEQMDDAHATIQRYAEENKASLLVNGKRSFQTGLGVCAFKARPVSLAVCAPLTWDNAIVSIKEAKLKGLIRTTEALDKKAITDILKESGKPGADVLADMGFELQRSEDFFFTPHTEKAAA